MKMRSKFLSPQNLATHDNNCKNVLVYEKSPGAKHKKD